MFLLLRCLYCSYTKEKMELEIERVSREMYRAFNGLNEGFQEVSRLEDVLQADC